MSLLDKETINNLYGFSISMKYRFSEYDVIVIGAGHAGLEAALASSRMGENTLLITQSLDNIAKLSCNPSIGGVAKGTIVREIDALGGEMARLSDASMIQYRLLNKSRGAAVQAPRVQVDKSLYSSLAKHTIELQRNLHTFQDTVVDLLVGTSKNGEKIVEGVVTERGRTFSARAVVLCSGTFMEGMIYIGEYSSPDGRLGERAAMGLGQALEILGFKTSRLKTGTPMRILRSSVDFSYMEEQVADEVMKPFSFEKDEINRPYATCYVTHPNEETHKIIRAAFDRSPLFSGKIKAIGARYCPSIEDKVKKFPERTRHHLYIEPEGLNTEELYINGLSSSLPEDVQDAMIRTIPGLENVVITRPAYAVDYLFVHPTQMDASLHAKMLKGFFLAGQVNGTSGYEEAGGQGIVAGINAALFSRAQKFTSETYVPFTIARSEAYIGVMIDDLVTQGVDEPYRMFTARAEYRLRLRHDNADERLSQKAYEVGLQKSESIERLEKKLATRLDIITIWDTLRVKQEDAVLFPPLSAHIGKSFSHALQDPRVSLSCITELVEKQGKLSDTHCLTSLLDAELEVRYKHYLEAQDERIAKIAKMENTHIPANFDYDALSGLSTESLARLKEAMPSTLGQASRIPGIRPSDIMLLSIALRR